MLPSIRPLYMETILNVRQRGQHISVHRFYFSVDCDHLWLINQGSSLYAEIVSQCFTVPLNGQKCPQVGVSVNRWNILKNQDWNKEFWFLLRITCLFVMFINSIKSILLFNLSKYYDQSVLSTNPKSWTFFF